MKDKILKSNWFWIVCIIIVWEIVAATGIISSYILPSFSKEVTQLVSEITSKNLLEQVFNSFKLVILGLGISLVMSLIVLILSDKFKYFKYFILSDKFKYFKYFIRTICNILSPLPSVAILPLVIIWMGINDAAMLVLVIHSIVWPMIINLIEKVDSIPTVYHDFLRNVEVR